jgi:hypothetical protein
MTRSVVPSRAAAAAICIALASQPVLAQSLLDTGKSLLGTQGGSGGAGGLMGALPMDKIISLLEQQGYSKISGLLPSPSGNTLQATATDKSGSLVDLLINPMSGKVLSAAPK